MNAALEYNDKGCLLWSLDCPGAFSRGMSREEAVEKLPADVETFCRWAGWDMPQGGVEIVEEKYQPELHIEDADSDLLFQAECKPLTREEYEILRELVLKSARDFETLYGSVLNVDLPLGGERKTFYGDYPNTARSMYVHTNSVTSYYVGEVGGETDNLPDFYENRLRGLIALEQVPNFLALPAMEGSYGEFWSVRKVMRRFLWHDRIHARAMYRRAAVNWGELISNPFCFER